MTSAKKSVLLELPDPLTDDDVYNRDAANWLLYKIELQKLMDEYR